MIYESLWWIVAARLADMAVRRFIWVPLEIRTQRKVPDVMKFFVTLLLFVLAIAGITAFVFNQTLTSLLATSGVLAMVIGLAIQSNIANVFSGIILKDDPMFAPEPRYRGVVNVNGYWVAQYNVGYRVKLLPKKSGAREQIWSYVRQKFVENNIALVPSTAHTLPVVEDDASKKTGGNG